MRNEEFIVNYTDTAGFALYYSKNGRFYRVGAGYNKHGIRVYSNAVRITEKEFNEAKANKSETIKGV